MKKLRKGQRTIKICFFQSPIIFQRVPAHQTKIEFPNELGNSGTMIFAVSANYKEDSSGMATTLCIPHENTGGESL